MDISTILLEKYAGFEWTLDGDSYEGLTWLSDTPKPTEKELSDLWPTVLAEVQAKEQAKLEAKQSAIAKLQALGLTVEEVQVAFGLSN
jgi:hypothetical protein